MILSGNLIRKAFEDGVWTVQRNGEAIGVDELKINSHSLDVTLGGKWVHVYGRPDKNVSFLIDPSNADSMLCATVMCSWREVQPKEFMLGCLNEAFDTRAPLLIDGRECYFTQKYDGRSSMGRLGILSHCTAGYFDYGFTGYGTLELFNCSDNTVRLFAGMRIGQITFEQILLPEGEKPECYNGAYVEQPCEPQPAILGEGRF